MNTQEIKLMEMALEKNEAMAEAKLIFTRNVREAREQIRQLSFAKDEIKKINKLIMEYQDRKREFRNDIVVCNDIDKMIKDQQERKAQLLDDSENIGEKKHELERKIKEYTEDYALEVMQIDNRFQRRKLEYLKEKELEKA